MRELLINLVIFAGIQVLAIWSFQRVIGSFRKYMLGDLVERGIDVGRSYWKRKNVLEGFRSNRNPGVDKPNGSDDAPVDSN